MKIAVLQPNPTAGDASVAAQDQSEEWMATLSAMARHYRCGLTIGWAERDGGDCIYNAACVFGTDGWVIAQP